MIKENGVYEQLVYLPYLTSYKKVIEGAIELDIFSQLTNYRTAEDIAKEMNWDPENTKNLLEALYSLGFVIRNGEEFKNSVESDKYLVSSKPEYMGSIVLFFGKNQGMDVGDVAKQVREGGVLPEQMSKMQETMDFAAYGDMMRIAQSGIRQQEIIDIVRSLPENEHIKKILDLGCGAGMIGIALVSDHNDRIGILYDMPQMKPLIEESVITVGMSDRVSVMTGDFTKDGIGDGYDLILASSIMLFAMADLSGFMKKLYNAVAPGGVVLCLNEGIAQDYSDPWEMIIGYLPMKLQGIPMGIPQGIVKAAAEFVGFSVENRTLLLANGTHDINILRK